MRVYYIVLLAATLSATINAEVTHSSPRLLSERQSHLTTGHLRSLKSTNTNQEERISFAGFELKVGVIDNMLERAKMSPTFKAMVDKRASAADALKAFTVRKTADDVLDTPAWKEWAQYVIYRAVKNNDAPDEALGAAMSVAYTPAGLSSLVAKSMANPNTKTIAKALEQSQINRWLDGNYKPSAIFKTLSLEKTDDIFGSPAYGTFRTFLTAYNKKNPSKMVDELDVFRTTFKEETIVKLLASADDSPAAVKLREQLITGWMNEAEHPVNMFTRLKLHEAGDDLLTNPLLSTWVQYMKQFNEKYPKFESTMLSTFTKNYGDEKISLMIQAATKSDDKNIVEFAKNLQTAQFKRWMADDKTPKEMLSFFKLNTQTFLNDNPAADVWKAYNKAYTKENGGFAFQP